MAPRLGQLPHRASETAQPRQLHGVAVIKDLHASGLDPIGEPAGAVGPTLAGYRPEPDRRL
jgi:hypothetical protein